MSQQRKTLITVATYNERENLPLLVEAVFEQLPAAEMLVVDDGSPDGTGQWCDEYGRTDPRLRCLHRSGKLGLGTAIVAAMRYAVEHDYEYMLNMDADFSHHPRYLPAIVAAMDPPDASPADVVIGSRYVPGGGVEGWPLKRRLMSAAVNLYARTLLGLRPRDCSGGYRCYRVALLRRLDTDSIISRGYSFQEEVLWRLKQLGARCREVPILFADRRLGTSKINGREAWAAVWILFRLGINNWLHL